MNKTRAATIAAMGVLSSVLFAPGAAASPGHGDIFSMCLPGYQLAVDPPLCGAREAVNAYGIITIRTQPVDLLAATGWDWPLVEKIVKNPPCGGFPWQGREVKCKPAITYPIK